MVGRQRLSSTIYTVGMTVGLMEMWTLVHSCLHSAVLHEGGLVML